MLNLTKTPVDQPQHREKPPAGWYDPIATPALSDEEKARNAADAYRRAELEAFSR